MIVDGNEIEVLKKRIKNLHLYVLSDGKIRVSAPIRMTLREIEEFIHSKVSWIEKHQNIIAKRQTTEPMKCVDGESVVLWGEKYTLIFKENEKINCARLNGDCVVVSSKQALNSEQRLETIEKWKRQKLKEQIPPLIEKWQNILGVTANEWSIKKMKTRWGSCNVKVKRVWLNLQLVEKPPNCLDYVVAHELCHLRIGNHSKAFKALMTSVLPNWRQTQKQLNELGIN